MDPKYYKGIEHFNNREFFEAHEIWEDLWNEEHGEAKEFIQGLIQYATSLHHFESQNLKGAKILYDSGSDLLKKYGDVYWEMPVKKFIEDMTKCCAGLIPHKVSELPGRYNPRKHEFPVKLVDELVPRIELKSSGSSRRG